MFDVAINRIEAFKNVRENEGCISQQVCLTVRVLLYGRHEQKRSSAENAEYRLTDPQCDMYVGSGNFCVELNQCANIG